MTAARYPGGRTIDPSQVQQGAHEVVQKAIAQSAQKRAQAAQQEAPAPNISAQQAFQAAREEREKRAVAGEAPAPDGALPPELPDFEDLDDLQGPAPATTDASGAPEWAAIPAGLRMPDGWTIWFIRFPAEHTNTPRKGEVHPDGKLYRQCILWCLAEQDEKRAYRRAAGDGNRVIDEMAKAMIRAVDGHLVQPGIEQGEGSLSQFWSEIGGKCRHQLKSIYLKTHTMQADENARFFEHCVAPRTAG